MFTDMFLASTSNPQPPAVASANDVYDMFLASTSNYCHVLIEIRSDVYDMVLNSASNRRRLIAIVSDVRML